AGLKVLVVSNPVVFHHYGTHVMEALRAAGFTANSLLVEAGETHKTPATVARIHDACWRERLERGSLIVALGGGVVGDMAGFAAATWLRGIAVAQMPTTLLAMVDAAIGGKTGVNHPGGKNLIGAFHQPRLVLVDPDTLSTLPEREFQAGMAEVIKYGVIGDVDLFTKLEQAEDLSSATAVGPALLIELLCRSAAAKAAVVAADERESGRRAILNYGHTLGHVLETLTGYNTYLHGEAVALGMQAMGWIASREGHWQEAEHQRQTAVLAKAGLPLRWPPLDPEAVVACLNSDKKVRHGRVRFVVPRALGRVEIRDDISAERVGEALEALQ
ncbi:MAG: 3-dehydroquinate synthase, partial [Synechococcus sp. SB0668_bin_15]|nr:3-dehydroquinate synthase [Synechococcus sp. SB0668_bin_15]